MSKTFRAYDPEQLLMLPPSVQEWLPEDHEVHFVNDVVASLDLWAIYGSYDEERGYPPYHPLLMTKLLVYGYVRGVHSSRQLARACQERVDFRVLTAGQQPDFRTIAGFRSRHLSALADLFEQVVKLCREAGLVKLGHVAVDGTKVRANASKHKAMSYGRMDRESKRLRAQIESDLEQWAATDAAEDARYGAGRRGDELPEHLADRQKRLAVIEAAKAALEAEAIEKGRTDPSVALPPPAPPPRRAEPNPPPPRPDPKAQRNFTDPDSRIMLSSDKAFIQAYNAQLAVDASSQVIVATEVLQAANDRGQLPAMIDRVEASVGARPKAISADAGYWGAEDIERVEAAGTEAFVAPRKYRHREWHEMTPPRGRMPNTMGARARMERKLRTKRGRAEYNKRKVTVEPVCGQIKHAIGFRQFSLRGHTKVRAEWSIVCMAHNLRKLFRAGWTPPRGPLTAAAVGIG